jgi:PAS domain S-box-containing protein
MPQTQPANLHAPSGRRPPPVLLPALHLALAWLLVFSAWSLAQAQDHRVLVLHSYHDGFAWTDDIEAGIENVLSGRSGAGLHVEYMDTKRHHPETMFPAMAGFLRTKYGPHDFSVVLATDDNATRFMLEYGPDIFPGTPMVFCGVNDFTDPGLEAAKGVTGVVEALDLRATLETALDLHPQTSTVAVVTDTTPTGLANLDQFRELAEVFTESVAFKELVGPTPTELARNLADLPRRSLVFRLSYFRDHTGRTFDTGQSYSLISDASPHPVYTMWAGGLDHGCIGGKVVSGRRQGEHAAEMAAAILDGAQAEDIPILYDSPNVFMFDYGQLKRFEVDFSRLPEGSVIRGKPDSFYLTYRYYIWAGFWVLAALALWVVLLTVNILRRRRAETRLTQANQEMMRQVRETHLALRQARDARDKLDVILKSVADGLVVTDLDNRVIIMNSAAEQLLGVPFPSVVGSRLDCSRHDFTFHAEICQNIGKAREARSYEFDMAMDPGNGGQKRYIRAKTSVVLDANGQQTGIVTIFADVTRERELDRMKTEFITTAAHELRTPLTSIQGFSELLINDGHFSDQDRQTYLDYIHKNALTLSKIISDLLDISRIESGQGYTLDQQPVDIVAQSRNLIQDYGARHPEFDFRLEADPPSATAVVDPQKFIQVLENLLSNAVKYSPQGGLVRLGVEARAQHLHFAVSDQGIGMDDNQKRRIFEKFYRGHAASGLVTGTGLGMSIVRHIIKAHKGRIWVESDPGAGTTIHFTIPWTPSHKDSRLQAGMDPTAPPSA